MTLVLKSSAHIVARHFPIIPLLLFAARVVNPFSEFSSRKGSATSIKSGNAWELWEKSKTYPPLPSPTHTLTGPLSWGRMPSEMDFRCASTSMECTVRPTRRSPRSSSSWGTPPPPRRNSRGPGSGVKRKSAATAADWRRGCLRRKLNVIVHIRLCGCKWRLRRNVPVAESRSFRTCTHILRIAVFPERDERAEGWKTLDRRSDCFRYFCGVSRQYLEPLRGLPGHLFRFDFWLHLPFTFESISPFPSPGESGRCDPPSSLFNAIASRENERRRTV